MRQAIQDSSSFEGMGWDSHTRTHTGFASSGTRSARTAYSASTIGLTKGAASRYQADMHACRRLMRGGSRSFFLSSLLLPARVRLPATALYAFCRVADDAVDESTHPEQAIADLHARLDEVYDGRPAAHLADRALACVVENYRMPRALLDALLEGFEWDTSGRRYETIEDLHAYGARVAGTVGAMMAVVMETRDERALARACELGVAMQLTNIARDVGEDARRGRIYLPAQWMREAGLDPDRWLRSPTFDPRLASVIERLLTEADRLYRRAECGISALPRDCRPGIQAARLVYAEIGQALRAGGLDSVNRRTVVARGRQIGLVARASAASVVPPGHPMSDIDGDAPLAAIRHLVEAAADERLPDRTFYQRTVRMLDLFERVGQRQKNFA
ncbi:MAG: phytoene/squalene synthase family protein [Rubrivivax sp.]|jgi:phytoene synthase